jgi:cation/acetate symporter
MNKEGAIAGMIIGLLLMLFYMLKFKFGLLMEKMLLLA